MRRITNRDLDGVVARINRITNSPATCFSRNKDTGDLTWHVGHYFIDMDSDLVRIANPQGAQEVVLTCKNKRELYHHLFAWIAGYAQGEADQVRKAKE